MQDFKTDLDYSWEKEADSLANQAYRRFFPHLSTIEPVTDLETQKKGIDKILTFTSGNQVFIDEKKRRTDYGDILIEEYSNYKKKKFGWISREKHTDYISYIIEPSKKVYIIPFLLLQKAWLKNYQAWVLEYGRIFSYNVGYKTSNIPVPEKVLFEAIKEAMTDGLSD